MSPTSSSSISNNNCEIKNETLSSNSNPNPTNGKQCGWSKWPIYTDFINKSSLFRSNIDPDRTLNNNTSTSSKRLKLNRTRSRSISTSSSSSTGENRLDNNRNRDRVIELKMNAVILMSVFFMGVLSAVFLCIWTIPGNNGRKGLFQPLPQVEHLMIGEYNEEDSPFDVKNSDAECDGENPLGFELEAVSALHAALEMKDLGKHEKAQKLFKHAVALCPRHPDILTYFGEFLEKSKEDVYSADHLYLQALTYAPYHTKAISNRKRTSPVVDELDERRLRKIDEKRDLLLLMPDSSSALRRVKKEAYFQHIYHTAGIEGNTMTLSETRFLLETRMAIGGKSIMEHNEIIGLDEAMKFINSSLVHRIGSIRIEDILEIHRHVMSFVDPNEAGKLRRTQVYVGSHKPTPPTDLEFELKLLVEWLNSEDALTLHPIHYAALAHYKLVYIHPFLDGNGRTSRLIMNWILMQAGYPPVIIRKQDRQLYYEHLNTANKGDVRPFIRFIADATEKTVDVYLWSTRELSHYKQILGNTETEDESNSNSNLNTNSNI